MAAILVQAAMNPVTAVGAPAVHVRGPGVERHSAELEQQSDAEQAHAGKQQTHDLRAVAQRVIDRREGEGARIAVEQRGAVDEERRGERAQQEVLQRRFLGQQPASPGQAAEQVERQRQDLQRDEHGDQVVGRREEHHPATRANSASGNTSVCSDAAAIASRSARVPGTAEADAREDAGPISILRSANIMIDAAEKITGSST